MQNVESSIAAQLSFSFLCRAVTLRCCHFSTVWWKMKMFWFQFIVKHFGLNNKRQTNALHKNHQQVYYLGFIWLKSNNVYQDLWIGGLRIVHNGLRVWSISSDRLICHVFIPLRSFDCLVFVFCSIAFTRKYIRYFIAPISIQPYFV